MSGIRSLKWLAVAALLAFRASAAFAAEGLVVNPWVTTDRSVNCFDAHTLVADVTRGLSDPQDQAVALYSFFQRTMFPFTNRNEYPFPENDQQHMFDFVRMVNVYGYSLCSQTSMMFASLLKSSGLFEDARAVNVPGHTTAEVKWNGRWHFMDPIVGCFVFRRDRREIASIEDIVADTTLLTRAGEEGRGSVPLFPYGGESVYPEGSLSSRDEWFTYRKYGLDFLLKTLPKAKPWEESETITHTMAFNLRPGFRLKRLWDHLPGMYNINQDYFRQPFNAGKWSPSPSILPPHHPDGGKGGRDSLNFPIFKHYLKTIKGRDSYRYYANGILSYEDHFTDRKIFAAADSIAGLEVAAAPDKAGGLLRCAEGASGGCAVFSFEAPYVFVGGKVSGRAQVTEGSWAAVYMDGPAGEEGLCLGVVEKSGGFSFEIPKILLGERYRFKLELRLHKETAAPGAVNLREFAAEAVCQLNMYSLPFLAPGSNRVTFLADRLPRGTRLKITYDWVELGWNRSDCRVVGSAGESYAIEVAGEEYPKMKAITMEFLAPSF